MKNTKNKNGFAGLYVVLLVTAMLLALIAFGAGYWLSSNEVTYLAPDENEGVEVDVVDDQVHDEVEVTTPAFVESEGTLQINWYSGPEEVEPLDIVKNLKPDNAEYDVKTYVLGTVAQGQYNGMMLTVNIVPYIGMGETNRSFYLITSENESQKPILLDRYAHAGSSFFVVWSDFYSYLEFADDQGQYGYEEEMAKYNAFIKLVSVDAESTISEFELNDTAFDQSGNEYKVLGLGDLIVYPNEIDLSDFKAQSLIEGKTLYSISGEESSLVGSLTRSKNLFFTVDDGGRIVMYDLIIPFWNYDEDYVNDLTILTMTGAPISGGYLKALSGGCGYASVTNVVDEDKIGSLAWLGYVKGSNGGEYDIYEPENYSMEYYLDDYNTWKAWHEESELEDFLALHPILYYQDGLGRWIRFTHIDALSQAECGKPVIYLYPEVETKIDVILDPKGGFTYTEPVYDNGWSVMALPDGTLVNLADGLTYPYLFWEGRGGLYSSPEKYWVVEKSQVEGFLTSTLHEYGLNDKETADFMEFWLPRMQSSAYYKIGFHGTEVMNAIAPMTLSVQPDSILRILMDYTELEAPIEQDPPAIIPFDREGFAVVEWGGVIW